MILRYGRLHTFPRVFQAMTGFTVAEFDRLGQDFAPLFCAADQRRRQQRERHRAPGGGPHFQLAAPDQLLLVLVWLRHYPTNEVLGYLFGVSDSTASRCIARVLPLVETLGVRTMGLPDPKTAPRKTLPDLLRETPALAVVIDSFEQRVQRPQDRETADRWYSGKKKQHTIKSQVAVDETDGRIVDVSESVPGPTADVELLRQSHLMERLPEGVGGIGDLAYVGIDKVHPAAPGATPRRKPRGKPRPEEDRAYNRAFSQRRIVVEHGIARLRKYQALAQTDRHYRKDHQRRVRAVAGLVNHRIKHRSAR
jgi:hypothetical protein